MLANHPNVLGGGGVATNIIGGTGLFADGTVAAPSISFLADQDTGIYRIGANNIGVAAGGAKVLDIAPGQLTLDGVVIVGLNNYIGRSGSFALQFGGTDYGFVNTTSGYSVVISNSAPTNSLVIAATTGAATFAGAVVAPSLTAPASTALALAAGSGNQNITLTPSGTGALRFVSNDGNLEFRSVANQRIGYIEAVSSGSMYISSEVGAINFLPNNTQALRMFTNGRVGINTVTDSSNGILQLSTNALATTSAYGIGFGTDTSIYRSAAGQLTISGVGNNPILILGPNLAQFQVAGLITYFDALAAGSSMVFRTNASVTALTLDSSQKATFAGNIVATSAQFTNLNDQTNAISLFAFSSTLATYLPTSGTAAAGGSATQKLVIGQTNQGVELFWGSGAPTVSGRKGSLYMRTDGSGINDRMYVNTNGSTTWTSVVTVA